MLRAIAVDSTDATSAEPSVAASSDRICEIDMVCARGGTGYASPKRGQTRPDGGFALGSRGDVERRHRGLPTVPRSPGPEPVNRVAPALVRVPGTRFCDGLVTGTRPADPFYQQYKAPLLSTRHLCCLQGTFAVDGAARLVQPEAEVGRLVERGQADLRQLAIIGRKIDLVARVSVQAATCVELPARVAPPSSSPQADSLLTTTFCIDASRRNCQGGALTAIVDPTGESLASNEVKVGTTLAASENRKDFNGKRRNGRVRTRGVYRSPQLREHCIVGVLI